jgi:hypothetical protein
LKKTNAVALVRSSTTNIKKALDNAASNAENAVTKTVQGWESSNGRKTHWSTYRATCARSGMFKSLNGYTYNWNDDLAGNLIEPLVNGFVNIFHHDLPALQKAIRNDLHEAIKQFEYSFFNTIDKEYSQISGPMRTLKPNCSLLENQLVDSLISNLGAVREASKKIHRSIKPSITADMEPAYRFCATNTGKLYPFHQTLRKTSKKSSIRLYLRGLIRA